MVRHSPRLLDGWIVPAYARPLAQDEGRATWMRFDEFDRFFDETRAKHVLVAMDCCYSGRLATGRSASASSYSERYLRQKAHVVLTSGRGFEEVSDGVPGTHSPFAEAFLGTFEREDLPAITSSELFSEIDRVFAERGVGHLPQLRHAGGAPGQFVFFLEKAGALGDG